MDEFNKAPMGMQIEPLDQYDKINWWKKVEGQKHTIVNNICFISL